MRRSACRLLAGVLIAVVSTVLGQAQAPRCNPDPYVNEVFLGPLDGNVQALADALVDDAAFRAAMGGIVFVRTSENVGAVLAAFPELHDAALLVAQLRASGAFRIVVLNGPAGCLGIPPPDQLGTAVEYYNASLDHYFLTADAGEKSIPRQGVDCRLVQNRRAIHRRPAAWLHRNVGHASSLPFLSQADRRY